MAAKLRALEVDIGVNLGNLTRDLNNATTSINQWASKMGSKLGKLPISPQISPQVESKTATKDVESIGSAILPLGSQIQSSLVGALAPLNAFAGRFSGQFDKVGATIISLSRRIDSSMKFPLFDKFVTGIRERLQGSLNSAEGSVNKFARGADKALAGIQGFVKVKNFLGSIGDVASKSIGKLTKLKPPIFNFSSSTTSILNMSKATQAASNGFKSMAGQAALALGIFGIGYKAVSWLKDGVKGAVDLAETVSKVETVFGDASKSVIANADQMAKAFGLPKQAILDASASIGLVGKAAGYSQKDAADLGTNMAKLAADASSFYNVPIEEALTAMRSGLVGEAEPLRRFGVLLSEDAVKAEAMRLGLVKAGGELSEQAKVTARASLITKGLSDANGDLERTQGSAANQGRKFTGALSNMAVSVGQSLLPALTKGLGLLNEFATWAGAKFEENKAVFEGWGQSLSNVFDMVGVLFRNWSDVFEIARLKIYEGLVNIGEQFEVLGPNIATVAAYIGDNWYQIISDAFNGTLAILKNFYKNLVSVGEAIGKFFADPTQGFEVNWTPLLDGFKATVGEFPKLLEPKLTSMAGEINKVTERINGKEADRNKAIADKAQGPMKKGVLNENAGEAPNIKAMKELDKFAKKFQEDVQTPFQRYNHAIMQAKEAHDKGLISDEEYRKAPQFARKEAGLDGETKFAGAADINSKEAYSSIISAMSGRAGGVSNVEKAGLDTAKNTRDTANAVKVLAQKAGNQQIQFVIPK